MFFRFFKTFFCFFHLCVRVFDLKCPRVNTRAEAVKGEGSGMRNQKGPLMLPLHFS